MYKQLVKAKLFIDKNYADNIDLNQIAQEAHFSKFHFIRLFRNVYEFTPNQYLTQVRIEHAKKLLEMNLPIREVCMSVGFESISSFKGLYKRYTGETLSAYQSGHMDLHFSMKNNPDLHIPHCLTTIFKLKKKQFPRPQVDNEC